jgi:phosphopantothenoylcysteine decarboxylase/phosphopantothenate--cysteine ligase
MFDFMGHILANKKILIGITGGIAAYKVCYLIRDLQKSGAEVRVCMTPAAQKFVGSETFAALSGYPVFQSLWSNPNKPTMDHISYSLWPDLYVIAPCTANTLSKLVTGAADDPVSISFLAHQGPSLVVPAMNTRMYAAPAVQNNLKTLIANGVHVLEAPFGEMACGEVGAGRFAETSDIIKKIYDLLIKPVSGSNKILITAGRTEESIDPVRYISNRSSGKTASAIAEAFIAAGHEVIFVHGPMDVSPPLLATSYFTQSASDMHSKVLELANTVQAFILCAAVADFKPANAADHKIKGSAKLLTLDLVPNPNILKSLSEIKAKEQLLISFALESESPLNHAQDKLDQNQSDLIVVNTPIRANSGFGKSEVECALLIRGEALPTSLRLMTKIDLAQKIVEFSQRFLKASL